MAQVGPHGGSTLTRILRLASGGDGVGKLEDGRAVFVPRSAPGDLVELTDLRRYARFARGRLAEVVEPGAGRIIPRCRHYIADQCGGCQLQHLDYEHQLEIKRGIVQDALERIGRLEVQVPPVVGVDQPWGYRSRIALALAPGRRHGGLHPLDRPDHVFPLEQCEIAAEPLMRLWHALRPGLHLIPADTQQLVLRLDRAGGFHVVVRTGGEQAWGDARRLAERILSHGVSATIWWHPDAGTPRVVAGDRDAFPATVFEQVHSDFGDRVRRDAISNLGPVASLHVWDLYAGIGETSERLFALGATVESVELDRRAVEYGERRWHDSPSRNAESQRPTGSGILRHVGKVEELLGRLQDPALVIANPPRTGMDPAVVRGLRQRSPQRIVYVSCDPATLARDLARLCESVPSDEATQRPQYRVATVQAYDLFPQTAHVETVAVVEVV